jgi:hypothetical protein
MQRKLNRRISRRNTERGGGERAGEGRAEEGGAHVEDPKVAQWVALQVTSG